MDELSARMSFFASRLNDSHVNRHLRVFSCAVACVHMM